MIQRILYLSAGFMLVWAINRYVYDIPSFGQGK